MSDFLILRATFISFLLCVVLYLQGQPSQNIAPLNDTAEMLFKIEQQDFSCNDKEYRLYIAQPKGNADLKRPVLYILDGNGQFPMLLNQIAKVSENTPLIVGIGYQSDLAYPKERTHDYTIPVENTSEGGGAEDFFQFISQKVKPFIEKNYSVDTDRQTLGGHSHAGQFVLYVAFNHTKSFNNYISGSPSLWWGDGAVIPKQLPLFTHIPQSITIALGEYEEKPHTDPRLETASEEIKQIREQRRSSISHYDLATMISQEVSNCRYIVFEGKNHGSSIPEYLKETFRVASSSSSVANTIN